jgi:hypothetical protein
MNKETAVLKSISRKIRMPEDVRRFCIFPAKIPLASQEGFVYLSHLSSSDWR